MRRTLAASGQPVSATSSRWFRSIGPGPMDNIPLFGDRKNGRVPIAYPHPMLEEVLKETYGIFVTRNR
jgi:DNA polymerase-3 subunit alpha